MSSQLCGGGGWAGPAMHSCAECSTSSERALGAPAIVAVEGTTSSSASSSSDDTAGGFFRFIADLEMTVKVRCHF
ncbi:unnamed protein product [Lampetra fluviatilis]